MGSEWVRERGRLLKREGKRERERHTERDREREREREKERVRKHMIVQLCNIESAYIGGDSIKDLLSQKLVSLDLLRARRLSDLFYMLLRYYAALRKYVDYQWVLKIKNPL